LDKIAQNLKNIQIETMKHVIIVSGKLENRNIFSLLLAQRNESAHPRTPSAAAH
jgi:hypothetical protein